MSPHTSLASALHDIHQRYPDRVAVTDRRGNMTYAGVCVSVAALAEAYLASGLRAGDRVLCPLENRAEFLLAVCAAWTVGIVHVGVDPALPATGLARIAASTAARAVLQPAGAGFAARPGNDRAQDSLVLTILDRDTNPLRDERLPDLIDMPVALGSRCTPRPPADAVAALFLTHGTTGQPKFPFSLQRALLERWGRLAGRLGAGPEDVHLAHLPMTHGFGLMMAMVGLLTGGRIVLPGTFATDVAFDLIAAERVTVLSGSPTLYRLIVDRSRRRRVDLGSVRMAIGSAAPFSTSLLREIVDELGLQFMLMYGASEGFGVVTTDPEDVRRGSVGRPQPGSVVIVDTDRRPVPAGSPGEIAVSRRMFPVRYWGAPAASDDAEWYFTGDAGRLDEDGRLFVHGRLAHQINRGGLKIDPVSIETTLIDEGLATDAAVTGLPDEILGEVVCACVVPPDGGLPGALDLERRLLRALGTTRVPDRVLTVEAIPRSGVGKIDYRALKARLLDGAGTVVLAERTGQSR